MITNEIPGKQSVADTFSPGKVLGENLTLKQKLSDSDLGIAWLAADSETGKDVMLLFLPGMLLGDSRVMEELRAQVKLNRQLIHPRVLRTHDFIEEEGWAAISSDAVDAVNLASLLAKKENGCFAPAEVQAWLSAICQALDDAHRAGLLHRDLVPRNILLTTGGEILIANFGISRIILDALGRALGRGKIDEHLASMSPQQLDGEYPARWDDIYALGALIYQLLTGKPPFYSGDILPQIRKTIPSTLAQRRAEIGTGGGPVPDAWEKVVASCLDKHTQNRPKSAREVGVKLGAEISMAPSAPVAAIRAEPSEPAPPEPKPAPEIEKRVEKPPAQEPPIAADAKKEIPAKEKSAEEKPAQEKEAGDSKESLVEDIVWRKPQPQPQRAPGESPSFKHLLQKIPEEQRDKKAFPIRKVAAVVAFIAGVIWIISLLSGNKPPAPKAPVLNPTPQIARATPPRASVSPSPAASGDNDAIRQIRQELERMNNALAEKTKARQQAEAAFATAKAALDAETPVLDGMKKAAADAENLRKQREDEEAKAAADATKASDDLKAAQKAADEKAALLAGATKAKDAVIQQIKQQEEAQKAETLKVEALQKAGTDKQAAADAAGNAEKDARASLQAQQALLAKVEAEAAQQTPAPSPAATGTAAAVPSGTIQTFVTISPGVTPTPSVAVDERNLVNNLQSHQTPTDVTPPPVATPAATAAPAAGAPPPGADAFTNSLGMRFQPVGDVLFCIWLTRLQDFEVFAKETRFKETSWLQPGFKQGPDHPVIYMSWNDAMAFCKWLTDKEHKSGTLPANQFYRLPTDLEWSKAVGLPEETGKTPDDRDVGIKDVYPWGTQWPPPIGAGNYDGEETDSEVSIKGFHDGYVCTSPVGAFAPNKYGLYDMGGNAWEWCMDWYNGEQKQKVLRGASWYNGDLQLSLLSSCRWPSPPDKSSDSFGFRCVIATEGRSNK